MPMCYECVDHRSVANHPQVEGEFVCAYCFEELGGEKDATTSQYRYIVESSTAEKMNVL